MREKMRLATSKFDAAGPVMLRSASATLGEKLSCAGSCRRGTEPAWKQTGTPSETHVDQMASYSGSFTCGTVRSSIGRLDRSPLGVHAPPPAGSLWRLTRAGTAARCTVARSD